jgi:hypothetical protein
MLTEVYEKKQRFALYLFIAVFVLRQTKGNSRVYSRILHPSVSDFSRRYRTRDFHEIFYECKKKIEKLINKILFRFADKIFIFSPFYADSESLVSQAMAI